MEQLSKRNGWQQEETVRLWQEIEQAATTGEPLRSVFERMGEELKRKPNSVRNFYYMQLRSRPDGSMRRAAPFELFSQEEIRALVREVLISKGRGESVRSCVMRMSGGDEKCMLRLQNKYRSVLSKRPQLICEIAKELADEGVVFENPVQKIPVHSVALSAPDHSDPDAATLYRAVDNLLRRAAESDPRGDRARAQRDVCLMQLEDLQKAACDLVLLCKELCADELGDPAHARRRDQLTQLLSQVENLCGAPRIA